MKGVYFLVAVLSLTNDLCTCADVEARLGIFDIAEKINETLQEVLANIEESYNVNNNISSGEHDWGLFIIEIKNGTLIGLNELTIDNIEYEGLLHLRNLSMSVSNVTVFSNYCSVGGFMNFPFSEKPVELFGSGPMELSLLGLNIFVTANFKLHGLKIEVSDLLFDVNVRNITLHLENLMGGGDLGAAFDVVLNDSAVLAFEFFKGDLVTKFTPVIIDIINGILSDSSAPPL